MNYRNQKLIVFILLISLTYLLGCSRGSSTVIPDDATYDSLPAITDAGQIGMGSDRQIQGIWETSFDLEDVGNLVGKTVPTEPFRTADLHLNVRPFIKTPDIFIRSWNPTTETLDLDVMIKNTSIYNGYDLRLIIFRDTIGHKLLNPDNYTHLWDIPEGTYSNGFKAYAKDNPSRILQAGEWKTERLQILCPNGNFSIKFAIDASWPSNCEEPYMMNNFTQGMLQSYAGAASDISVDVYDWQDNVDSVRIQCSAITGESDTYMTKISGNKWGVELINNNAVLEGDYFALIAATSSGSTDPLIHIVNVSVSPEVGSGFALTWGGAGEDCGFGISVDNDGNIFCVGKFINTVDFNPDPIEEDIHTSSSGYHDAFLSKFDSYGDHIWTQTWGADGGTTGALSVDVDSEGSIFVCGDSESYLPEMYMIKFNQNGDVLWQGNWGDGDTSEATVLKIRDDMVVVGGFMNGNADFDPGPGVDFKTANGLDAYINVFDTSCNHSWSALWGGASWDQVNGIDIDSNGNVYSVGWFYGTTDLDPGTGTDLHISNGYEDAFLNKLDSDGNLLYGHTWGANDWDEAADCAVDEFDDVYVVGWFYYTVDFDPDPVDIDERTAVWSGDIFYSKFNSSGDFQWVLTIGGSGNDKAGMVSTDQNGHFYTGGATGGSIDLNPGPDSDLQGGKYISKFGLDGSYVFSRTWSGEFYQHFMDVSNDGSIYIGGWYDRNDQDFDPGPGMWYTDNYVNGFDAYLIKTLNNGFWY